MLHSILVCTSPRLVLRLKQCLVGDLAAFKKKKKNSTDTLTPSRTHTPIYVSLLHALLTCIHGPVSPVRPSTRLSLNTFLTTLAHINCPFCIPVEFSVYTTQSSNFLKSLCWWFACSHFWAQNYRLLCFTVVLCICYLWPHLAWKFLDKYCSFCFVSFSFPVELSLLRFLSAELTRGYFLEHNEAKYTERRERVYTCMRIPRELEKVLFFSITRHYFKSYVNVLII